MSADRELLLRVWREACRHIEIQESSVGIMRLVQRALPLGRVRVFRVEPDHQLIACVADATLPNAGEPSAPVSHQPQLEEMAGELKNFVAWIRREVLAEPDGQGQLPPPLHMLDVVDGQPQCDRRGAALIHGDDTLGVLLVHATPGAKFSQQHEQLIRSLVEPFSVALANDRRLHELAALREAAEADRRSLLRRLGRTDLTEQIVGEGRGLAQVMKRVQLVSQSDAPVLLLGETGTGKELVARAVHERSGRGGGPFIRVNCGAIPAELIDSQLFGHQQGAFTGASETRRGWFERADGGTLFLDEIGELPSEAQVRFLRVLQDALVERVGGTEPIRVDVRVIAATHRDLAAMVQERQFREDLWYRIAVFPILLPPLRERLDDIAELAEHFAVRAANRFSLPHVSPTAEDLAILRQYSWPGNVRELGVVIDRAAILGEGRALQIEAALGLATATGAEASRSPARETGPPMPLDQAMRHHIEQTLGRTQGRVEGPAGAAQLLQINPHTLRARMRKLGIDWTRFRKI